MTTTPGNGTGGGWVWARGILTPVIAATLISLGGSYAMQMREQGDTSRRLDYIEKTISKPDPVMREKMDFQEKRYDRFELVIKDMGKAVTELGTQMAIVRTELSNMRETLHNIELDLRGERHKGQKGAK